MDGARIEEERLAKILSGAPRAGARELIAHVNVDLAPRRECEERVRQLAALTRERADARDPDPFERDEPWPPFTSRGSLRRRCYARGAAAPPGSRA